MSSMDDHVDAFAEGREAYDADVDESANPYPIDSDEHLDWNDGWWQAFDDDLEDA